MIKHEFEMVNLIEEDNGDLTIELTDEGKEDVLDERLDDGRYWTIREWFDGMTSPFCNGWEWFDEASELGHLSDAPLITDDGGYDDEGEPYIAGRTWYFGNYMIDNPMDVLREEGRVTFTLLPEEE